MDEDPLLLGISDQAFGRGAKTVAILILLRCARYLWSIAVQIGKWAEHEDGQDKRLDKLETAVFGQSTKNGPIIQGNHDGTTRP